MIKITADSACDLGPALLKQYDIGIFPLGVNLGDQSYLDGVDIQPDDIYAHVDAGGDLPATAAVNPAQYAARFAEYAAAYDAVIHVNIGSAISSSYQNACIAAADYPNVHVVDSRNLSTGFGHVVLEAARCAAAGMEAEKIAAYLREDFVPRVRAGFVLGRLDYMKKGGRCSAVAALGANLLKLRPSIAVKDGAMGVVKKYRGTMEKALREYVADQLQGRTDLVPDRIFITHSGVSPEIVEMVRGEIRRHADFREITETRAGCTISSHCGPDCLGILFVVK